MNKYIFTARDSNGKKVKGRIEIENVEELSKVMLHHNYQLLAYKKIKFKRRINLISKITKYDLLSLCENLYLMLKAGIDIKKAFNLCGDAVGKIEFKNILKEISKDIDKGKPISVSLQNYNYIFPNYFITMFNLAEKSGNLLTVLKHLINTYRFEVNFKKKVKNALFYPCLLVLLSLIIIIVITTVVIPTFIAVFEQMEVDLPLITKIMIKISNFIKKYLWLIIISTIILFFTFYCFFKTKKGKYIFDKLKLKIPLYKNIYILNLSSKICRTLSIMLNSGVSTISSLQTTLYLTDNLYVKDRFKFAVDEVKRGIQISTALYFMEFIPSIMIETIKINEQSSSLAYSLDILANIFEEDEQAKLQKIVSIIEPLFILIIALIVVILVIAIFIPLFSMFDNIGGF